jgi:protein-S-isoprenylcysteine O-methyltransferase Ste14
VLFLPFVVAYVNWVVIPLEETKLDQAFGREYGQYRSRVRRWI